MTFSEFAQMLYPFCGDGKTPSDFVVALIGNIAEDTEDDRPLLDFKPDYLKRIYNGKKSISQQNATFVVSHLDKNAFSDFVTNRPDDAVGGIRLKLAEYEITATKYEVGNICADLFAEILTACATGSNMRKILDEILTRLLQTCKYDGFGSVYFNQRDFDVVVNGNLKDSFGKGYRAFLNTIMAIAMMEYLGEHGKFAPGILIIDSPILSLKEKVTDKASDSMKSALFQYLLDNQEHGQVIIVENDIPKLDYSTTNVIQFTKDIHQGRYGFLNEVR